MSNPLMPPIPVSQPLNLISPCGAWCFLLGLAGVSAGGGHSQVIGCVLPKGHDGEHSTTIESFAEPKVKFTITWRLG